MARRKKDKMQELMDSDNGIIKALRDEKWIYNPKVYAQVAGDFSLLHQRVLLGVLDKLQDRIALSVTEHNNSTGEQWLPLFSDDELNENIDFEIDPRELGIGHEHYKELAQALKDLVSMRIGYPQKKGNKWVYVFAPLFSRLEMPMTESGWRTGKIRVKMDKENVNDFFSMERGYTDHVAKIAQIAKKQRTPRLYIYLSTFRYKGKEKVKYPDLTEFLGIDDETYVQKHKSDNPAVRPTDNPFHKFSKVKKLILEPSREEMDKLSRERKIDFSFTYKPLYEGGRKKGNPTHIEFVIVLGDLGQEREHDRERHNKIQQLLLSLTKWCADLNGFELTELCNAVNDLWLDDFLQYAYKDMRKQVEQKQPDNVARYAMTLLNDFVRKHREDDVRRAIAEKRNQWNTCFAEIRKAIPDITGIATLETYSFENSTLHLSCSRQVYDAIERNAEKVRPFIVKYFGQKFNIQYRLRKELT